MSAAPVASESSPAPTKDEKLANKTIQHMRERAKDTLDVVLRGDLVWRMLEKGKGSQTPSSVEMTPFAASKEAVQRSRLARESTDQREKEEADRAKRIAEREASRESQRRARGSSTASNLSTAFRSFMPRRSSNLSKVEVPDMRPVTFELTAAEMRPFTFEQAIRYGQQHGRGVESVAEEILTRNNSVANMGSVHETRSQPTKVVRKAHSADQLMPIEAPAVAEGSVPAVPEVAKTEDVRATKSAADLREGAVEKRKDSGWESMGTSSLDSVRRLGVLAAKGKEKGLTMAVVGAGAVAT
ncbi:MAG: hypothetical protein Q9196_003156 [Gyalolechia fulgens]